MKWVSLFLTGLGCWLLRDYSEATTMAQIPFNTFCAAAGCFVGAAICPVVLRLDELSNRVSELESKSLDDLSDDDLVA